MRCLRILLYLVPEDGLLVKPPAHPITGDDDYEELQTRIGGRSNANVTQDRRSLQSIELSSSMEQVISALSGDRTITALGMVKAIMELDDGYVSNRKAGELAKELDPTLGTMIPPSYWLEEVRSLFDHGREPVLHGHLVILGLAMIDADVRKELTKEHFLNELVTEYADYVAKGSKATVDDRTKFIETLLTEKGVQRWKAIFLLVPDAVPTHADDPSDIDLLGREPFARALAIRLQTYRSQDSKNGSFLAHIYGPWGSGKSTFLGFLKRELEGNAKEGNEKVSEAQSNDKRKKWIVVEFNAWQHQKISPPWWTLMDAVYTTSLKNIPLTRRLKIRFWENCWRLWHGWSRTFWLAALFSAALGIGLISGAIDIESASSAGQSTEGLLSFLNAQVIGGFMALIVSIVTGIRAFGNSLLPGTPGVASQFVKKTSDPMEKLKSHFEKMVCKIQDPVAIFVDDLDRCQDGYVVDFLEGVQTVFRKADVIFVIAADRRWLYASFQKAYSSFSETLNDTGRPLGYLFLDKIFQISVSLPRLSTEYQKRYLDYLMTLDEAKVQMLKKDTLQEAAKEIQGLSHPEIIFRLKYWSGDPAKERAFREVAVERLAQPESEKITENFLRKFSSFLEPNPRSMKRFVTAYGLWRAKDILAGGYIDENILARWVIITLRWPIIAHYLEEHPDVADWIDRIPHGREVGAKLAFIVKNTRVGEDLARMLLEPQFLDVLGGQFEGRHLDGKTIQTLVSL
jgi:hypothetical protein